MAHGRVLMIYIEPAPYILAQIRETRRAWAGHTDVVFMSLSESQKWKVSIDEIDGTILPAGTWAALLALVRILRRGRYDIIHLAGWGRTLFWGALLYAAWKRIPVVMESDTQPRPRKAEIKRLRYKRAPSPYTPTWKRVIKRATYPLLLKLPSAFLPAGTRQIAYLKHYGVAEPRLRMAKMTVDVESIMTFVDGLSAGRRSDVLKRYGIPEQQVRFLYVGRLERYKGIMDVVDGLRLLSRDRNDVCLIVVGEGSLTTQVLAAAADLPSLHYIGRLDNEEIWEAYAISDVAVVPSHLDNWGLVVNEAMAAGLPVIATTMVGCIDDLVHPGSTGLVVRPGVPIELSAAMAELASDAALRRRMAVAARRLISDWTLASQAQATTSTWAEIAP